MLHKLADAHQFARRAELLLRGFEGGDGGLWPVCPVQVPGEEAGKVLQRAQELVASNWEMELVWGRDGERMGKHVGMGG
jgi:hypothetical protein